jgi:SAM-dependent methyltransferase
MELKEKWILDTGKLDLAMLSAYTDKPEPFEPGEVKFWDDVHISSQMLAAHLDPELDAASRKPGTIDASVAWIVQTLGLVPGAVVLDLGCGPGLYAVRLAAAGMNVSGVDISPRSILYARETAAELGLSIDFQCQNYLTLTDEQRYDAVLLIFGDFCTFSPEHRRRLLRHIFRVLKPDGHFVLDVSTRAHRAKAGVKNGWYISEDGFWRPGPHLVLEQGFDYPEQAIWLDQYIVLEENGTITVYRNWFQDYDQESICEELAQSGFEIQGVWGDLTGSDYSEDGEWIGVVAQRTTR